MRFIIDEKGLDLLTHPYFEFLLRDLYFINEDDEYFGWKVKTENTFVFMYQPDCYDETNLEKCDLLYWGAYFNSAENMFNLTWFQVKDSLVRFLRKKGFEFKNLT